MAAESEVNAALAQFIKLIYVNTETVNKGDRVCLYGSDSISLQVVSEESVIILDENGKGDKQKYKKCRIIYVARNKEKLVKSFVESLNKSGALTMAAFSNFVNDGGMMFIDIGRRDFELTVNASTFKASGVKLDSSITGLIINTKN